MQTAGRHGTAGHTGSGSRRAKGGQGRRKGLHQLIIYCDQELGQGGQVAASNAVHSVFYLEVVSKHSGKSVRAPYKHL